MDRKKIIVISIMIITILLIILLILLLTKGKANNTNTLTTTIINDETTTKESDETTTTTVVETTAAIITTSSSTTKVVTTKTTNNNEITTTSTTTTTHVPTCPDGYEKKNNKCISEISRQKNCDDGWWSYSDDLCINMNGNSYEITKDESCREGYGYLATIGFGTPTVYHCYPVKAGTYTCPDGYTMKSDSCIRIIDAS